MDANFAGGLTLIFVMGYCSIHSAAHIEDMFWGPHTASIMLFEFYGDEFRSGSVLECGSGSRHK